MTGLAWRGVIECFYGKPWSAAERKDFFRFAETVGFNHYVYAPKDDSYHRDRWREPYPADQLAVLGDLVSDAAAHGVHFVYALARHSPCTSPRMLTMPRSRRRPASSGRSGCAGRCDSFLGAECRAAGPAVGS